MSYKRTLPTILNHLRWFVLVVVSACSTVGCQNSSQAENPRTSTPDASSSSQALTVLVEPSELQLSPGESRQLSITILPPGNYNVIIYLTGTGTTNAFVDTSSLSTEISDAGTTQEKATVVVAGRSDDFFVNVVANDQMVTVPVEVGANARADMRVVPLYNGPREVKEWVVNTKPGGLCEDTTGLSAATSFAFNPTQPTGELELKDQTASEPLTLYVRSRRNVVGCRRDVRIEPGRLNEVEVEMTILPLRLADLRFPLVLGLDRNENLDAALLALRRRMFAQFVDEQAELRALLSAMADAPGSPTTFEAVSRERDWGNLLERQFRQGGLQNTFSQTFDALLSEASNRLHRADLFVGELVGQENSRAEFVLRQVDGQPQTPLLSSRRHPANLEILNTEFEELRVGFELLWQPAPLLAARAEELARRNHPEASGNAIVNALQVGPISCEGIAVTLAFEPWQPCNAECFESLCNSALLQMWSRAAQNIPESSLGVTVTGRVVVGEEPVPIGLTPTETASSPTGVLPEGTMRSGEFWSGLATIQAENEFNVSVAGRFSTLTPQAVAETR